MTRKPNRFCFGVVVIFTFAALSFDPGACEPVGYSARASEPPARHGDVERALTTDTWAPRSRGRRQGLGSRQISSSLMKTKETFRDMSEFTGKPKMVSSLDQYQNNPPFHSNCSGGEVQQVIYGNFDFTDTDVQAQSREELRPVVECGQDSMTLTVRGTRAVPLRVITGTDSSLALSELPSHCGFSVHKSWREIALVAQYNGCYVTAQNDRHVLPLLWRRTPVRMSCPVSPVKSQSLDGLSQCCSSSGLTISLRDPSMSKEPSVNVRGEWTPLDELVQHCGFSLERGNAETVITVPFLACGVTSRGGHRTLSLQIGEEVFFFTCPIFTTETSHESNGAYQFTTTQTKPETEELKPNQWTPPYYLAPLYYPHPTLHHRARVPQVTPPLRTVESLLKTLVRDEQNDHRQPPHEYYSLQPSLGDTSTVKHPPPPLKGSTVRTQPHKYVFNPYYHYYHHPKIPQNPGSAAKSQLSSEMTGVAPLFHLNSATELYPKPPLLPYAVPQHDVVEKTNFESEKPMHGLPEVYKQHNMDTVDLRMNPNDQKPFGTVPPAGESTPSASPHPPTYTHWPLPYYYLLFYGPKSENDPFPAAAPAPQSANPLLQSDDVQQSFVSDSHSAPELFAPVHDAAEDLMNEGQSTPHSDLSQWGENYVVLPPLMSEDDGVEGHTSASVTPPLDAPDCPGTGSHFHFSTSPVKDCILGEYLLFSLPEFVGEPKVSGPDRSNGETSCVVERFTSSPNLYFVPLKDCGVTKQVTDSLIIYQLQLETRDSDSSLIKMMVECIFYPGFLGAETLFILDPFPAPYTAAAPVQMRIATDESLSFHPSAHLPLHSLRGRLVYIELTLLPPDPAVALWVHSCMAYTLTPYVSAMVIYDGCSSGSASQHLPSVYPNTQYIVVPCFLSLTSPSPLVVDDVDPEVYFVCLTEVCPVLDGVCISCPE
ncbi:uncharacterized protein LOC129456428 [Periophthalmus magnuspinnatus]|uniref:uncharacterized protein LOC129456428 n=1 Tax=Periophthalmus magnuspinnatus TaxID=409849 RepID=UPI0024370A7E|nr:uncharacterized protein LOC129456428 [Periophthalmus magnuspinnatus]